MQYSVTIGLYMFALGIGSFLSKFIRKNNINMEEYEDRKFYEKHPTFQLDTVRVSEDGSIVTDSGTYQVIAACYSRIYSDNADVFKYYEYPGITTEEEFNSYVNGVLSLSVYDTGLTAQYGDQLVTLSTCAYQTDDGRFFVVGKRIGN